jgi:hypothetical protein
MRDKNSDFVAVETDEALLMLLKPTIAKSGYKQQSSAKVLSMKIALIKFTMLPWKRQ